MPNKWTRRAQAGRRGQRKNTLLRGYCIDLQGNGRVTCNVTQAPPKTQLLYLELHALLPKDIRSWSEGQLHQVLEAAEQDGGLPEWRKALIFLAHHRSELARALISDVQERVPRQLAGFWELAYAESLGWLGYDYLRDEDGRVRVVPAGTAFSREAPC